MKPLVDAWNRPHTYLRLSVTDRCNLRCRYCAPQDFAWKPREEILSYEEIVRLARLFIAMGVRKIRLTGGEPTVRKGLEGLVARLSGLPGLETLAMTTNGVLLKEKVRPLRAAGLTALNVSLDTLRRDRYTCIAGQDRLEEVLGGIEAALEAGLVPLKLNAVVMAGINDDELCDFVEFARARPVNVRFIEYMPFRGNDWDRAGFISHLKMMERIGKGYSLRPARDAATRGTAREFRADGIMGSISFITPLSAHFCQACTRVRLTADGAIKCCLFHPAEVHLRGLLRDGSSEEALAEAIRAAVASKPLAHPPVEELAALGGRAMIEIGG